MARKNKQVDTSSVMQFTLEGFPAPAPTGRKTQPSSRKGRIKPFTLPYLLILPEPILAANYAKKLESARTEYLVEQLLATLGKLSPKRLNDELEAYVPEWRIQQLLGRGLRGEFVYPVPYVLEANPKLIAYYRLLLGYGGKSFYRSGLGLSSFKTMESGTLVDEQRINLPSLCRSMIQSATQLVDSIGIDKVTRELLDGLTIMSLGVQVWGSRNNKIGEEATDDVYFLILEIVQKYVTASKDSKMIELTNAAGRKVTITFASNPDVTIVEEMSATITNKSIAIEIKGGQDEANIHNRTGEAEKSHQTARSGSDHEKFTEFWTIVNVDGYDLAKAKVESPTTNRFYLLSSLKERTGEQYEDFKARIASCTGIPIN